MHSQLHAKGVLIVEDTPTRQKLCEMAFNKMGIVSQSVANLQDFYNATEFSIPEICLLDANVPLNSNDPMPRYVWEEMLDKLLGGNLDPSGILVISDDEKFHRYAQERGCVVITEKSPIAFVDKVTRHVNSLLGN